jgi:hypothetical protein
MKKIKQIKDIRYEKIRLQLKQIELEKQISKKWDSLKSGFAFKNINADKTGDRFEKKPGEGSILINIIEIGAGYLSRRLSEKAGQQLELTLQKGAHKLVQKLKTVLGKRK